MSDEEKLEQTKQGRRPWYFTNVVIMLGFLCLYPFILPLIWQNPYYSSSRKVLLTFLILVTSGIIVKAATLGLQ